MTSGLFDYVDDTGLVARYNADPMRAFTPPELLKVAFAHRPYFPPGKGWHYSNTNYVLLGMIVEKVTGRALGDVYRERIFTPLGMRHTALPGDGRLPDPHPRGYMFGPVMTSDARPAAGAPLRDVTNFNPAWAGAAGAAVSTLDDLHRFAKPLATGVLVGTRSRRDLFTWIDTGSTLQYGFGVFKQGGKMIGHNGSIPGFQTYIGYRPDRDLAVVVLANLQEARDGQRPADALAGVIIKTVAP